MVDPRQRRMLMAAAPEYEWARQHALALEAGSKGQQYVCRVAFDLEMPVVILFGRIGQVLA